MKTKSIQKKRSRTRLIKLRQNRAKYEKKIPVIFLDGSTIRLKTSMAHKFKKIYGTKEEAKKATPEASPLAPGEKEVGIIKSVVNTTK